MLAVSTFCQHQFSAGDCSLRQFSIVVFDSLHYPCNYISNWVALPLPRFFFFLCASFWFRYPSELGLLHRRCADSPRVHCFKQDRRFSPPDLLLPSPSFYPPLVLLLLLRLLRDHFVVLALLSLKLPSAIVPTAECAALDAARSPARPMSRAVRSCPPTSSRCTMT